MADAQLAADTSFLRGATGDHGIEASPKLVRAAARGDRDAIGRLYRRYWADAFRTAAVIVRDRSAAEDIAQEAMLKAISGLTRFNRRKPFGPWLHRIVVNRSIDEVRAASRRPAPVEHLPAPEDQPVDGLPPELDLALAALEPTDRAIVVLRFLFDYRSHEIGEMTEMPAGTVRRRLSVALEQLRGTYLNEIADD